MVLLLHKMLSQNLLEKLYFGIHIPTVAISPKRANIKVRHAVWMPYLFEPEIKLSLY